MGVWDLYEARTNVRGTTRRDAHLLREKDYITRKTTESLSYFTVSIIDSSKAKPGLNRTYSGDEKYDQDVSVINTDNSEIKHIISLPDESLRLGDIVEWKNQHWIINEKDFNDEVYVKCIMTQCNYLLRWVDQDGNLFEQWCVVEDGTKLYVDSFRVA